MTPSEARKHLRERGMNPHFYEIAYNEETVEFTFPLYNGAGIQTGYQVYRPLCDKVRNNTEDSRYYTYLPKMTQGVFGLECFDPSKSTLYVVEGLFKAAVLHRLGFNAIAVLTSTPKHLKPWLEILNETIEVIGIGDGDKAGGNLVKIVGRGFCSLVDLDEMTDTDIMEMLKWCSH